MLSSSSSVARLAGAAPRAEMPAARHRLWTTAVHAACMRSAGGSTHATPTTPSRRRRGLLPAAFRRRGLPPAASSSSSSSSSSKPSAPASPLDDAPVFDVHLLLAVARMRATDAFAKEAELLYKPAAFDDDDAGNDAKNNNNDGNAITAFSLLRAAALMTAALDEPQLSYGQDVLPAVEAAARAAERRLLAATGSGRGAPLAWLRRAPRPETERLERVAAAVAAALRLDARLAENAEDPHDPRNFGLDRRVLRALAGADTRRRRPAAAAAAPAPTGPAIAAVLFAELARRMGAGVALAGPHDRPLLRLFDRAAAERAPTSADVAAGEGAASAWAETTTTMASEATTTTTAPVTPPPSVLVDPCAALWPQEGDDEDDDHDDDGGRRRPAFAAAPPNPFLFAWSPEAGAWVPTAALDRGLTHPREPPRAWATHDPSSAPPLATRAMLHAALSACKRSHAASGRFADALAACRLARRVDPLDLDELRDEGALLSGVGRWAEAAAALRGYLSAAAGVEAGGPPDAAWVEAEAARAVAMAELEGMRARRAAEEEAEERMEGEGK